MVIWFLFYKFNSMKTKSFIFQQSLWLFLLLILFHNIASAQVPAGSACKCTQYLYMNDPSGSTNNGYVHKFRIDANGGFTEMPNGTTGTIPWFRVGGGLTSPHGLGQDVNGNLYIGETAGGDIRKLTCDGTIAPETGTGAFRIATGGYNFTSRDGIDRKSVV